MYHNPEITFLMNPSPEIIDWKAVVGLFKKVQWGRREPSEIREAFQKSSYCCFVLHKEELIAMGRTIDDGRYYAMLVDIAVDPEFQNQGIGKEIVQRLKDHLSGYKFITLSAAAGKHGFYEKIGWKRQNSAFIFPVNDQQAKDHSEQDF